MAARAAILILLATLHSLARPAEMNPERCVRAGLLDQRAVATIDPGRIAGTSRRREPASLREVAVDVTLGAPAGVRLAGSTGLDLIGAQGAITLPMVPGRPGVHAGRVPPGTYLLRPSLAGAGPGRDLIAPPQRVVIDQATNQVYVHLSTRGQPYFRIGAGLVPFAPSPFTAVVPAGTANFRPETLSLLKTLTDDFRLSSKGLVLAASEPHVSGVLLDGDSLDRARFAESLRKRLGPEVRVGTAINVADRSLQVLDNHYVIRFNPAADAALRDRTLARTGLVKVQGYGSDPDLWLVAFEGRSYLSNLSTINCLVEQGLLLTGEPDLIRGLRMESSVPADWPNDPRYPAQNDASSARKSSHANQRVRAAWGKLFDPARNTVAASTVRVGLIDLAIDPTDGELACNVDDGTPQIQICWDPSRILDSGSGQCASPLAKTDATHGMMMLGVIAACTNNGAGTAGIAPGVRINAVALRSEEDQQFYSSGAYADVLRWTGGLKVDCPTGGATATHPCRWPAISSDVISNSYTLAKGEPWRGAKVELPESIATAFEALTRDGRGGKGVVLVFAAGNWDPAYPTSIISPLAADPRTIAVSNCIVDEDGTEHLFRGGSRARDLASNFGDKIDVCADGEQTETIHSGCLDLPADQPCVIGGTSTATATVSGVVALMLSANPALTSKQVRMLLRRCADQIDKNQSDAIGKWVDGESKWYGAGRVNAEGSVQAAINARGLAPDSDKWAEVTCEEVEPLFVSPFP
jgi:subtilisin family serine protease